MLNDIRESEGNRREWIVERLKDIDGTYTGFLHKGELVRCRECKKSFNAEGEWICNHLSGMVGLNVVVKADDFCSYGEREGE